MTDSPASQHSDKPRKLSLKELLTRMYAVWPQLWPEWPQQLFRPVSVGTGPKMKAWVRSHSECNLSPHEVGRVMSFVVTRVDYMERLTEGAIRYNLEGQPEGVVTASEAEYAQEQVRQIRAAQARKQAENTGGVPGTGESCAP